MPLNVKIKEFLDSNETSNQQVGIMLAVGQNVSVSSIVDYFIHNSKLWIYEESKFELWYSTNILDLHISVGYMELNTHCLYIGVKGSIVYGMCNSNGKYSDINDVYLHHTLFNCISTVVRDFISSVKNNKEKN